MSTKTLIILCVLALAALYLFFRTPAADTAGGYENTGSSGGYGGGGNAVQPHPHWTGNVNDAGYGSNVTGTLSATAQPVSQLFQLHRSRF